MQCIHINIRKVALIFISLLINISQIRMAGNEVDTQNKHRNKERPLLKNDESVLQCPSNSRCDKLPVSCLTYDISGEENKCIYGQNMTITCEVKKEVKCEGNRLFSKTWICRYCYQTEPWEHQCELKGNCMSVASPPLSYIANCTVNSDVICFGHRAFNKRIPCNWTSGYRWSTALALSITLGGFGADRFYLGHWQEGIGKLFSFGGLGVWTIIDVILISLHYLGPADGSLYI